LSRAACAGKPARAPPEKPFPLKKKKSAGEISKNAKAFSGGARSSFAGTGGGACLVQHFSSK